jgi:hypothetical protein
MIEDNMDDIITNLENKLKNIEQMIKKNLKILKMK